MGEPAMLVKHRRFNRYSAAGEEAFLEDMAEKGWMLRDIRGLRYIFEQGDPGKYFYCVHWLEKKRKHEDSVKQLEYIRSLGAEEVCSRGYRTVFRRPAAQGEFFAFESLQEELECWQKIRNSALLWIVQSIIWLSIFAMRLSETGESKVWYFINGILLAVHLGLLLEYVWILFRHIIPQIRRLKNKA